MMNQKSSRQSFIGHLEILRWHFVRSFISICIGSMIVFFNKSFVFDRIIFALKDNSFPTYVFLCELSDKLCIKDMPFILMNIDMAGQFMMHLLVSFVGGVIMSFPYILYEFWSFVSPALYKNEKKISIVIVFIAFFLFIVGIIFGYYIIIPFSINFLSSYAVSGVIENNIHFISFIKTVTTIILTTGLLFQLPLFIYCLTKLNLVSPDQLAQYRRHAFVVILIMASVLTPPDVFSQILIGLPIFILYEISIFISKMSKPKS